jgi:uncharacterized membrane protein YphA (DoxX/SURF4 family)
VFVTTLVLSVLLALVFVGAGTSKIVKNPTGADMADRLGYPLRLWRAIGWLEVAGALGLLVGLYWAPIGETAALCLALLMVGAVISHLRVKDAFAKWAGPLGLGVLSVVTLILRADTAV